MITLGESLSGTLPADRFKWSVDGVIDLLLRPDEFFRHLTRSVHSGFPFLAIWIWGVAAALDRMETRILVEQMTGRTSRVIPLVSSWPRLWMLIIAYGIVGGPLSWLIGGWWYRMRLRFSGAREVNPLHARYLFLYSNLVIGVPMLLAQVLDTLLYPSHMSAFAAGSFGWTLIATSFWSIFVSYRGAVGCFEVRRTPARVWFLILPMGILAGVVAASMAAGLYSSL